MRQKVFPDLYSHERARVSGPPRFQRAAMIAAFHPPATFSVRFVRVLVSPAGEKVHAAGEKRYPRGTCGPRDQDAAVRDRPGRQARRLRLASTNCMRSGRDVSMPAEGIAIVG
jgi:hypothetical protein